MLPPESFLRNAPRAIDLKDRLAWEVIVNASDAIDLSYQRLFQTLTIINSSGAEASTVEMYRAHILLDCWSIIDNAHSVIQIVNRFPRINGGLLDTFLKSYKNSIYTLRNKIRHITQNIDNMSKISSSDPVYGSVSFSSPLEVDSTFEIIAFALGGMQFSQETGAIIDTRSIPLADRIANITLTAFGERIEISSLYSSMLEVLNNIDESMKEFVVPKLIAVAQKHGLDAQKLLKETVKGTVIMRFKMIQSRE
jgi:hypothetical protein